MDFNSMNNFDGTEALPSITTIQHCDELEKVELLHRNVTTASNFNKKSPGRIQSGKLN